MIIISVRENRVSDALQEEEIDNLAAYIRYNLSA